MRYVRFAGKVIDKLLWHAYAIAGLYIGLQFAADAVEWHESMFKVSVLILKALRGGTT